MSHTSGSSPSSGTGKNGEMGDNIAPPEQTLQTLLATKEWTTEDFLSAKPYPIPKITEEMVTEFIEKMKASSAKGGSSVAGGLPSSTDKVDVEKIEKLAGFPYPPPFNQ